MNILPIQTLAPVLSNERVIYDKGSRISVHLLWLKAPEIASIAQPGQFVMLKCGGEAFLRRPLSVHRISPNKNNIAFLFDVVREGKGKGTSWLSKLRQNDEINLLGPLGNGFHIVPETKSAVLIAGGVGIAPLSFLADELGARGVKMSLYYGAKKSTLLLPDQLLPTDAECVLATEDGSRGQRGFITTCLPVLLGESSQVFACAPTPMYRALAQMDRVHDWNVQVSLETRMACGLGICYGCTINTRQGPRQICHHGPVFNMHDIQWDKFPDIL